MAAACGQAHARARGGAGKEMDPRGTTSTGQAPPLGAPAASLPGRTPPPAAPAHLRARTEEGEDAPHSTPSRLHLPTQCFLACPTPRPEKCRRAAGPCDASAWRAPVMCSQAARSSTSPSASYVRVPCPRRMVPAPCHAAPQQHKALRWRERLCSARQATVTQQAIARTLAFCHASRRRQQERRRRACTRAHTRVFLVQGHEVVAELGAGARGYHQQPTGQRVQRARVPHLHTRSTCTIGVVMRGGAPLERARQRAGQAAGHRTARQRQQAQACRVCPLPLPLAASGVRSQESGVRSQESRVVPPPPRTHRARAPF